MGPGAGPWEGLSRSARSCPRGPGWEQAGLYHTLSFQEDRTELHAGTSMRDFTPSLFTDMDLHPLRPHAGESLIVGGLSPNVSRVPLNPTARGKHALTLLCNPRGHVFLGAEARRAGMSREHHACSGPVGGPRDRRGLVRGGPPRDGRWQWGRRAGRCLRTSGSQVCLPSLLNMRDRRFLTMLFIVPFRAPGLGFSTLQETAGRVL